MDRKEFLKTCGYACVSGTVMLALMQSCKTVSHVAKSTVTKDKLVISKTEFEVAKGGKKSYKKYVTVKTEQMQFLICIFRFSETEYTALSMRCTHRSCELKPEGDFLVCPCHGSEFTNKGVVQNPPAEQNLESYKLTMDNENIYIHV